MPINQSKVHVEVDINIYKKGTTIPIKKGFLVYYLLIFLAYFTLIYKQKGDKTPETNHDVSVTV